MPVGKFAFLRYLNLEVLEGKTDCHHKLPPFPHLRGRGGISKETILYDYMKVKRRWIFLMTAMTLIAIYGLAQVGERELAEYEEHIRRKEQKTT